MNKPNKQHAARAASFKRVSKGLRAAGRKLAKQYNMKPRDTVFWPLSEVFETEAEYLRTILR